MGVWYVFERGITIILSANSAPQNPPFALVSLFDFFQISAAETATFYHSVLRIVGKSFSEPPWKAFRLPTREIETGLLLVLVAVMGESTRANQNLISLRLGQATMTTKRARSRNFSKKI